MKYVNVESSNLKLVGYDKHTLTLEICFHNGAIYQYSPISHKRYKELIEADSVGKYFSQRIRVDETIVATRVA